MKRGEEESANRVEWVETSAICDRTMKARVKDGQD